MSNHYARARRNRGPWLDALLAHQASDTDVPVSELRDLVNVSANASILLALDSPAPARGYALLLPIPPEHALALVPTRGYIARVYMLENTSEEAARALFSSMYIHGGRTLVERAGLSQATQALVEAYGAEYGVELMPEQAVSVPKPTETDLPSEPEAVGVTVPAEDEPEASTGDTEPADLEAPTGRVEDMRKKDLVALAKSLGVPHGGTVGELRARLIAISAEDGEES